MYRGFNLKINWNNVDWYTQEYYDHAISFYEQNKKHVKSKIEAFIADDGSIDGQKMEDDWFQQIKADIFISHSHADKDKAICLAGYLNKVFDIKSFVDSCIWGNADKLLKIIDDDKCVSTTDASLYDYNKRNSSTSLIHMMLSAAILKMIDKTECLFLLKTPNSISASTSKIVSETESPWLYAEILFSSLIRDRSLADHRPELMKSLRAFSQRGVLNESVIKAKLKVYTGHLKDIDESDLDTWKMNFGYSLTEKYPLDGLYQQSDEI